MNDIAIQFILMMPYLLMVIGLLAAGGVWLCLVELVRGVRESEWEKTQRAVEYATKVRRY